MIASAPGLLRATHYRPGPWSAQPRGAPHAIPALRAGTGGAAQALAEAQRIVGGHAELAPLSLALIKRAVHQGLQMDLASGLQLEAALATAIYGTEDRRDGIAAFLHKRKSRFGSK